MSAGPVPAACLGYGRPGPGQAGVACPEDGSGAGAKRHGAGRTGGASPLGEAGLAAPDARPRPRKPRQGASTGSADTPGSRRPGDGSMPPEALTRGASRCGGHGLSGDRWRSVPMSPRTRDGWRSSAACVPGGSEHCGFDNAVAAIVALHRAVPRFANAAGGLGRRDRARAADAGHRHKSGQGRRPGAPTARLPRMRRLIA